MKADRAEVEALIKDKRRESIKGTLHILEQAEVSDKKLIGSPEWDLYLQRLQSQLDTAKEAKVNIVAELVSPLTVDPIEERRLKNMIIILDERIGTLDACINLPKDVIEQGEEARLQLAELDDS